LFIVSRDVGSIACGCDGFDVTDESSDEQPHLAVALEPAEAALGA
jgi:hypothetical protein